MLGTNDCKTIYKASPYIIGRGIEILIQQVKDFNSNIKILLVSPIFLGDRVWEDGFDPEFNEEAVEKSHKLKDVYKDIANKYGCSFLAASDYANPSETDQEHMNEEGHRALSNAIYEKLINPYAHFGDNITDINEFSLVAKEEEEFFHFHQNNIMINNIKLS